ncbi:hypothetical protein [Staphylococcus caeli]|uniref:hypothetical protein n=1 Tax=Staphylococcus caeli TaxID=2201815 RepID=UPI003F575460
MSILKIIVFAILLISFCILMFKSLYYIFVWYKLKKKKIDEQTYQRYIDKEETPMLINLGIVVAVTVIFSLMD